MLSEANLQTEEKGGHSKEKESEDVAKKIIKLPEWLRPSRFLSVCKIETKNEGHHRRCSTNGQGHLCERRRSFFSIRLGRLSRFHFTGLLLGFCQSSRRWGGSQGPVSRPFCIENSTTTTTTTEEKKRQRSVLECCPKLIHNDLHSNKTDWLSSCRLYKFVSLSP